MHAASLYTDGPAFGNIQRNGNGGAVRARRSLHTSLTQNKGSAVLFGDVAAVGRLWLASYNS